MDCKNYDISQLKPYIFLFGDANILKIKVLSVSFTSTSELNRRYSFKHELTFNIDKIDYTLIQHLKNHTKIGFEDINGVVYLANPELDYELSYDISYENGILSTSFKTGIKDNMPYEILGFDENVIELESLCQYSSYALKNVYINYVDYVRASDSALTYVSGHQFTELDYISDSLSFTSSYQFNGRTVDEVQFLVEDGEQNYLPFFENKYVILLQFVDDKYIILGSNNGLQANYDVALSSSENGNRTIDLSETYDVGNYVKLQSYSFVQLSTFEYKFIKYGSICTENNGYAKYLLKQKFDTFNNAYDDYQCLEGYSEDFPELNITDEFDTTEEYFSKECYVEPQYVKINTPTIFFNKRYERKNFVIESNTDWKLRTSTGIIITPNSGSTGTTNITIQNNYTVPQFSIFTIRCDHDGDTEIIGSISVIKKQLDDVFPMGNAYEYDYRQQIAHIPCNYPVTAIDSDYANGNIWYENNFINVELFENTTSINVYTISATTEWGTYELDMTQYQLYVDWRYSGRNGCDGDDLRRIEVKYISTDDEQYTPTQEERFGSIVQSGYCADWEEREVVTDRSYCDGENEWKVIEVQRSNDNWTTHSVVDEILGDWVSTCSANLTYSWSITTKIGKWNNRDCYLYIKTFYNVDTHFSGAVVPFSFSPDGDGSQPIVYVE